MSLYPNCDKLLSEIYGDFTKNSLDKHIKDPFFSNNEILKNL